ncbi:tetratricopeptide repeat protein [Reichenbachiella ulvae]|uniref:Tetratricopeptide repeat protein n=1 Tax=Reichenbachiella ulvae TaxID=2980104 RepID=A0ABT3CYP6_9BACT|nr:tetratricopeptide repeat protein [Reichenbachiella ulvae]MCV9388821.1 tetratricopeptide repeat protein [Reichenbachiella ulvae]
MKYFCYLSLLALVLPACDLSKDEVSSRATQEVDRILLQAEQNILHADSQLFQIRRALNLAESLEYKKGIAQSSLLMGKTLYQIGHLDLSLQHLHDALNYYENDPHKRAECNVTIGEVYLRSENYGQALLHTQEALEQFKILNNPRGEAQAMGQLGHLFEKREQYDSALYYQEQALAYFDQSQDSSELAVIYDNIGSIYEDLGFYRQAYEHFVRAYRYSLALGDTHGSLVNLNNMGDSYRKRGMLDSAYLLTKAVYDQSLEQQIDYQTKAAARDLSKLFLELKQLDSAYYYLDQSYQLTEVIFGQENAKELANAQSIFELEKKQQTIRLLEQEKSLTRKVTTGGFLAALIMIALFGYGSYLRVGKARKERKLLQTENELSKAELINAQLNEEKLRAELENKRLEEGQLQLELEMKNNALSRSALHLIQKNEFLQSLRSNLKKIKKSEKEDLHKKIQKLTKSIDLNFNMDDDWEEFENTFKQIHTEFFDKLSQQHGNLSTSEVRLCAMIHTNLHSHEIASIMGISSDSLRIARYRLRKKLGLEKGANLFNYLKDFS